MNSGSTHSTSETADPTEIGNLLGKTISDIGIPPCPAILSQINAEMNKDEPDPKSLDSIISADVGLAAGLIALANSPFFGVRSRVRSVKEALQMLGLGMASRAIASLILRNMFPPTPALERFWDASARIARLSAWLTQEERIGVKISADEAYTFGLFRDCGIPVLLKRFGEYPEVLKKANVEKEKSFTAVEDGLVPTNHAAAGCLLAQAWWLPDDLCLAIRNHHDYQLLEKSGAAKRPAKMLCLIAIAQLAEYLLQKHSSHSQTEEWSKGGEACLHLLGISLEMLASICEQSAEIATGDI